ncbi:MAG: TonB family protein [Bacteroidota bacterium]|nr:TonB family protein [Bacteroidota bacterium]
MKITLILFAVFILSLFFLQSAQSQDEKATHAFKIVGKTKMPVVIGLPIQKAVEYDPASPDHLIIFLSNKEGVITSKKQFLFKGKKFDLSRESQYIFERELIRDGTHTMYRQDGSMEKELIYKEGILLKETGYYPDGKKQFLFSGDERILHGEYKMWHANGQLSYSGNYKNNLKDGEFQLFDESGATIKKGTYQEGKLVSGEAVIHEMIYDHPDIPAKFVFGEEAFDEYLKKGSAEVVGLEKISKEKRIDLKLQIDQTGQVTKVESLSDLLPNELEILNAIFKEMPEFTPATVENIPVISFLNLNLILSGQGLRRNINNQVFVNPEEMPVFPGGKEALLTFISSNIRYPREAQEKKIQGKVFVTYIVNEDGTISDVRVVRGVEMHLDAEAVRVVKSMPKYIPGRQDGKPVKASYTMPINFILQ